MILLHPFIFAVYPIIFLYAINVKETPPGDIILPIILALILCLSFFLITKLVFKDTHKTGFLTSVFLILFFSYGHLFDFLRTTLLDRIIQGKHFFLYPFYILIFIVAVYKTWKSEPPHPRARGFLLGFGGETPHRKPKNIPFIPGLKSGAFWYWGKKSFLHLTKVLNIISSILILVPLVMITSFFIKHSLVRLPVTEVSTGEKFDKDKVQNKENLPDIYYIILDRYASESTLQRMYGYDNADFLSSLKAKGFYIASESQANYATTTHSLASSLNMTHLTHLNTLGEQNYTDWNLLNEKVSNNDVMQILKSLDYKTTHLGSWWAQSRVNRYADVNINIDTTPGFYYLVLSKTILHPLRVKLGLVPDFLEEQWQREHLKFRKLREIAIQDRPKFVFAHFLITHEPYTFRADGSFLDEKSQQNMTNQEKYLGSLKFTNQKTIEFVNFLLQNKDNYNPIIIIQSDEGPYPDRISEDHKNFDWTTATNEEIAEKMGILNAYYLPNGGDKLLYPTISPVNTFRIVFNHYFGQNYQLLSDDSFLSNMNQPYVFIPVKK